MLSNFYTDSPFPIICTQKNGDIINCNSTCERLLQIQAGTWRSKHITELLPSNPDQQIEQMIQDPELLPFIETHIHLEHSTLEVELFVQSQASELLWFFKDQTRYNELLREKKRNRTIPQKYGHDINNLLTVIISAAQLIEMDLEEDSPFHEDISDITEAAYRAAAQTKGFMNIGRQEHINHKRLSLTSFFHTQQQISELFDKTFSIPKLDHDIVIANPDSIKIAIIMSTMYLKDIQPLKDWALSLHDIEIPSPLANQVFGLLPGTYACISISDTELADPSTIISSDQYICHTEAPLLTPVWNSMIHSRGTVIQRKTQHGYLAISLYIPLHLDEESS